MPTSRVLNVVSGNLLKGMTMLMTEVNERNFTVGEGNVVLDEHGVDFLNEDGSLCFLKEEIYEIYNRDGVVICSNMALSTVEVIQWAIKSNIDLSNANFEGLELYGVDLTGGKFQNANFFDATLTGATLVNGDFTGADFTGAYLEMSDCEGAIMCRADFGGCDLRHSNMKNANAMDAEFSNADMDFVCWDGCIGVENLLRILNESEIV